MSRTFGRRRNGDSYEHPEGAPDPWDPGQPKWPPDEPQRDDPPPRPDDDRPFGERLHDLIDPVMREVKKVEARIRSCLLSQGLPELYAEIAAAEIAEGWANGDPAPLWTMPGYVPPEDDDAARAWKERWEEERRKDGPRGNPRHGGKNHRAGRQRPSRSGTSGYSDFTIRETPKRRRFRSDGRGR